MDKINKYNSKKHRRKSIRLKGYDYSQEGLYFVTICCQNRKHLFGKIENKIMVLNEAGTIANNCWQEIPNHFPNVVLHQYIIMPNHIHGIIEIVGAKNISPKTETRAKNLSPLLQTKNVSSGMNTKNISSGMNTKNVSHETNTKNILHEMNTNNDLRKSGAKDFSPLRSPTKTVGSIVRGFKIGVTKWMRNNTNEYDVWQRNYYEHIIRDEISYHNISEYIINNPINWENDKFFNF